LISSGNKFSAKVFVTKLTNSSSWAKRKAAICPTDRRLSSGLLVKIKNLNDSSALMALSCAFKGKLLQYQNSNIMQTNNKQISAELTCPPAFAGFHAKLITTENLIQNEIKAQRAGDWNSFDWT